jgi:hypothetical protein
VPVAVVPPDCEFVDLIVPFAANTGVPKTTESTSSATAIANLRMMAFSRADALSSQTVISSMAALLLRLTALRKGA